MDNAVKIATALSIAGFDPSGGAGVTADVRTIASMGVYAAAAITAITIQDTRGVESVQVLDPRLVASQVDAVTGDLEPQATKTGMLGSVDIVDLVAERSDSLGMLVIDPVWRSSSGESLAGEDAIEATIELLIPRCALVTPNLPEAERISSRSIETMDDARRAAARIIELGAGAVVITGGHWPGAPRDLFFDGIEFIEIGEADERVRLELHGTGCCYSAGATAAMASGDTAREAARRARAAVMAAIGNAVSPGGGMAVPWPPTA